MIQQNLRGSIECFVVGAHKKGAVSRCTTVVTPGRGPVDWSPGGIACMMVSFTVPEENLRHVGCRRCRPRHPVEQLPER
jgi:hypothetical protein